MVRELLTRQLVVAVIVTVVLAAAIVKEDSSGLTFFRGHLFPVNFTSEFHLQFLSAFTLF